MKTLYPYQKKITSEIRENFRVGKNCVLMCAPTGAGKTVMFSFMASSAVAKGKNALILTDRIELFNQAGSKLFDLGLKPEGIENLDAQLNVVMIQTFKRRYKNPKIIDFIQSRDLIIIDEAHKTEFDSLFDHTLKETMIVGATATPLRKGKQEGLDNFYHDIVQVVDTPDLIKLGKLAKCKSYGFNIDLKGVKTKGGDYDEKSLAERFNEMKLYHGVVNNYESICKNEKTLIFAPSRDASEKLVEEFITKGYQAKHIDCYMTKTDRKNVLEWFKVTPSAILSNYGILTTGFDEPSIQAVILYRATKSLVLFLQMVGRGSRSQIHSSFKLLDFGNNIMTHGFWEEARKWTLSKKEYKLGAAAVKECPKCNAMIYATLKECPECNYIFPKTAKEIEQEKIIELELLNPNEMSVSQLILFAKNKGYHANWVVHQLKTKDQFKEYGKIKGYKNGWQKHRAPHSARYN